MNDRKPFRPRPFFVLALVAGLVGCRDESRTAIPNRVLDRPLDATLGCVQLLDDDTVQPLPLEACGGATSQDAPQYRCGDRNVPHLIGFVANSERNEVAMFRRCDTQAALVDLDDHAPGYNFVPVGQLPSKIAATELACEVVTANAGSCDLSVLDGGRLAAYAVNQTPAESPSSLVSTIVPRLSDGQPLGARPGDILAAPETLSTAQAVDGGLDPDGVGGTGDPDEEVDVCGDRSGSVFVTFPSCQLVAEVSLTTQRILQSRQFVRQDDGSITVVDSGTDPVCPVECPAQFDGDIPVREGVDAQGVFPSAIALVQRNDDPELPTDDPDLAIDHSSLFVGGSGSDTIFEIAFSPSSGGEEDPQWGAPEETRQLLLEEPSGVRAIRPTPAMLIDGAIHQFLYVVAGDGSTRVVDRFFERSQLGVECDTQIDPTLVPPSACYPIEPGAAGNAQRRRAGVRGPGIRLSGSTITDWAFYEVTAEDYRLSDTRAPFDRAGVVGVGVTSTGTVVYATFGQFLDAGSRVQSVDPIGIMNVELRPHVLWPLVDPHAGVLESLPRVADADLRRTLAGAVDEVNRLAPSLRLIDAAYSEVPEGITVSPERQALASNLGNPANIDALGGFEGAGIYEDDVPRVAVRDFREWVGQTWLIDWEGTIPGASSSRGRIECDERGWQDATCKGGDAGSTRLVDASGDFCDSGVLSGDKVVIVGCNNDDECGLGQKCLREPTAPSTTTGICISAAAYDDAFEVMRQVCAPFIADPCGQPRREYLIESAFQDELWLRELDIPLSSHTREVEAEDGSLSLVEIEDRFTCELPLLPATGPGGAEVACTTDDECVAMLGTDAGYQCRQGICRLEAACSGNADCPGADSACVRGVCRVGCPEDAASCGECSDDDDCGHYGAGALCIDQQCRRPCVAGDPDCRRAELPGPRCFGEFVRYAVRAHESFVIGGSTTPFFADQVYADPETKECLVDPSVSNLLTSRLWLGEDEFETFNDPLRGIPDCPNPAEAAPTDPNPCRIVTRREQQPDSLFHVFSFKGETVSAVRFSNPVMSLVFDLTSLTELASGPDDNELASWPVDFVPFRRSRIPRGYQETFQAATGYQAIAQGVAVGDALMTYPVRIIPGPEPGVAFVVDAGGRPDATGVRGQVIRLVPSAIVSSTQLADQTFRVQ